MKIRHWAAMLAAGAILGGLTGLTRADAQSVGDIQTVPGYPGCRGNSTIQDVPPEGIVCANQRTFTWGNQSRTVTVVQSMRPDGSGTVVYTLNKPVNFVVPVRVVSHSGVSSSDGPVIDDVSGEIPAGGTTVTLHFRFVCGQVDVKAVFVGNGQGNGRISGGYFCTPPPPTVPTTAPTTAPGSTTPDTSLPPGTPVSSGPTSGPGASSARVLPATGNDGPSPLLYWGLAALAAGAWIAVAVRRRADA